MKVIVCGAGRVGADIAGELAEEGNDVVLVDRSEELVERLTERIDVQGVTGEGSHPRVLEAAGAKEADILIAVTRSDEVNMIAAQIAAGMFDVPTTIARVRDPGYLDPTYGDMFKPGVLPINVVISPEAEISRYIVRRLGTPGAFEAASFGDGAVDLLGINVNPDAPTVATPMSQLRELFPELQARVVGIVRDGRIFAAGDDDQLNPGDRAYIVTDAEQNRRVLELFGEVLGEARRVVVVGAGNIGLTTAEALERRKGARIKVIEADRRRATLAARRLKRTVVLQGSGLDRQVLREAGVAGAETVLALTDSNETNLLSCMLAKREGAERAIALVTERSYQPLTAQMGVDAVIDPREITVSSILRHVRRGRIKALFSVEDGAAEVIEAVALETSPLAGKPLGETEFPPGVAIGGVVRKGRYLSPEDDLEIRAGDRLIVLAERGRVRDVEQLFRVSLQYF